MMNKVIKPIFYFILVLVLFSGCAGRKIDSQLKAAEELKGTRKFTEALEAYKLIISRYPGDPKSAKAYIGVGDLYFYTFSREKAALESYQKVFDKWPYSDSARDALLKSAEIYETKTSYRKAISEREKFLKHYPDDERRFSAKLEVAKAYLSLNDPYQASIELEELLKNENIPEDIHAEALFDSGESYLFQQKCDKALPQFEKLVVNYSGKPYILDARFRMVECLEKIGKTDEAIVLQEELVKRYPDSDLVMEKVEGLLRREEKTEKPRPLAPSEPHDGQAEKKKDLDEQR